MNTNNQKVEYSLSEDFTDVLPPFSEILSELKDLQSEVYIFINFFEFYIKYLSIFLLKFYLIKVQDEKSGFEKCDINRQNLKRKAEGKTSERKKIKSVSLTLKFFRQIYFIFDDKKIQRIQLRLA